MTTKLVLFALGLSAAIPLTANAAPTTWEQWRGPTRDGVVAAGSADWPKDLSGLKMDWRVELAEGYSSPIVTEDRVFTVETQDKERETVRAFDRATGKQIWEHSWEGALKVPFFARKNGSWVRATPAYADGTIYVCGIRDVLVAIDAATGKELWRIDFVKREGSALPAFGYVSSPLVDGDHLYLQAGAEVTKLNRSDGSKVWGSMKDDRAMYGSAFSSPTIATVAGKRQLLVQTREEIAGLDPKGGDVLWKYKVKAFRGMNILTPTAIGDTVFTSSYGGGSFLFDVNEDDGAFDASKTWFRKTEGYMSSPLSHEGAIYMHGRDKRLHCLDAESGKLNWTSAEKFGDYSSLVANGDRALALTDDGELVMFKLDTTKFQVLAKKQLTKSPTWAHLTVCGDEIFIRELKAIARWRWPRA